MIAWTFLDRSLWALVAGSICGATVRTTLSHLWLPGNPNHWQWDNKALQEIFHFGKWMFLSSILGFFVNSGDRLLLSSFVDKNTLGIYAIAFGIYSSLEQILTRLIGDISFPALSEVVRERPADLKSYYYKFNSLITSFACFCSGCLMISGQTLIGLLYDSRYGDAGWMLQILAAALITIPFRVAQLCLLALGLPKLYTHPITIRLSALLFLTPIGFYLFGVTGALAGIVAGYFSNVPIILFYNIKNDLFSPRSCQKIDLPSFV
jgi:O-antigen/teichoic acid export membrane protein